MHCVDQDFMASAPARHALDHPSGRPVGRSEERVEEELGGRAVPGDPAEPHLQDATEKQLYLQ